tara:strand:- start:20128 stop:20733 length:606 start_codon:yes stop_codon:yes gene_type:complete
MLLFAYIEGKKDFSDHEVKSVEKIRSGNKQAFEDLFFEYHNSLIRFANTITKSRELARDCVQDVFLKIWRNREEWEIQYSLKAYLYQSVRNQALNLLEKQKARYRLKENYKKETQSLHENTEGNKVSYEHLDEKEIRQLKRIWELVEEMPERRRLAFDLNRRHGLSYKEISKVLNISRKTVENHIGQAVKFIRDKISLEDF